MFCFGGLMPDAHVRQVMRQNSRHSNAHENHNVSMSSSTTTKANTDGALFASIAYLLTIHAIRDTRTEVLTVN